MLIKKSDVNKCLINWFWLFLHFKTFTKKRGDRKKKHKNYKSCLNLTKQTGTVKSHKSHHISAYLSARRASQLFVESLETYKMTEINVIEYGLTKLSAHTHTHTTNESDCNIIFPLGIYLIWSFERCASLLWC